ncbi:nose resistant to fluoxetine protein 6-like isoform X2 [Corticium candelabrum]|uniref:nose resistant to fluoxetine protein 6-like isoform X2 n=1 Tax=Corticium candelabrum TaxID=121492 RepID=UPI002E261FB9|nr:nose resistant to fluoxetine protein 6-like isoform X2 [Corticium candelabrum]
MLRLCVLALFLFCASSNPSSKFLLQSQSHTQSEQNVLTDHDAQSLLSKLPTSLQLLQEGDGPCSLSTVGNKTALIMVDASGKLHSNMLDVAKSGILQALGDYDECLSLGEDTARYCLFEGLDAAIYPNDVIKHIIPLFAFRWALCVPRQCDEVTLTYKIYDALKKYVYFTPTTVSVCNEADHHYSTFAIIVIVILCLLAFLVLVATSIDYSKYYVDRTICPLNAPTSESDSESREDSCLLASVQTRQRRTVLGILYQLLQSFSLVRNVPKLLDTKETSKNISCLHGIRTLSMTWIILSHCYFFFSIYLNVSNMGDVSKLYKEFAFQPIGNGYSSVDSFFFLSGLLVMYLTIRQMEVTSGYFVWIKYYLHRIWRLTPTYVVALLIFWQLMPEVGDGPLWMSSYDNKQCDDYWWTNLLYINNFHPHYQDNCMGWTWFLAADTQMYALSPLLIVPAYYFGLLGLIPLVVALVGVLVTIAVIVTMKGFPANVLSPLSHADQGDYLNMVYVKYYTRAAPYIVGMAVGYYLAKRNSTKEKSFRIWSVLGWIIAACVGGAVVYGLYDYNLGHHYSQATSTLYLTFSSCMWGVCMAWIVYACVTGNGGAVDNILSWKGWFPLSRLTYCAYLLHPVVLMVYIGTLKEVIHIDHLHMAYFFVGVTGITYGCAAALSLGVEYPAAAMEKVLLGTIGI